METSAKLFLGCAGIVGVLVLLFAGIAVWVRLTPPDPPVTQPHNFSQDPHPGQTQPSTGATSSLDDRGRKYVGELGGYLKVMNERGMGLAVMMTQLESGKSTMGELRSALKGALFVEELGYGGVVNARPAPTGMESVDARVDEVHRLHQAAFRELLEYWEDQNLVHIVSGNAAFKQAVLEANATTEAATAAMKRMK